MKRWRDESKEADFRKGWSGPLWTLAFWAMIVLACFALGAALHGQESRPTGEERYATVRITIPTGDERAVNGSGTVISSQPGRSVILTCAHLWEGVSRTGKIVLHAPSPAKGPPAAANVRCVDVDRQNDLGLILADVEMPYVCPVAPFGAVYSRQCIRVGYDEAKLPPTIGPADIETIGMDGRTLTRQRPWHGASGGCLLDETNGWLVGVVSGYTGPRSPTGKKAQFAEIHPQGRGIYIGHKPIVAFLRKNGIEPGSSAPAPPRDRFNPDVLAAPFGIAPENRIPNRTGVQCVWSAIESLCRQHGITAGYDLTARYRGTAGPGDVQQALGQRGIRFRQQPPGNRNTEIIADACRRGLGCMIGIQGRHAIVCQGWDTSGADVIDNGGPQAGKVQRWTPEQFRQRWDGWVVVVQPGGAELPKAQRPKITQPGDQKL